MSTDVVITIDAKASKAIAEVERLEKKLKQLEQGPAAAGRSMRKMSSDAGDMSGKVTGMIASMASYAAVAASVAAIWSRMRADAERIADLQKTRLPGEKLLRQVSRDEADYQSMTLQSRAIAARAGIEPEAAYRARFAMRSTGLESPADVEAFTAFSRLGDIEAAVNNVATLRASFGGTSEQILNALVSGSAASKFDIDQLARAGAVAGQNVANSGVDISTFLASVATQQGRKSADVVADRLRALAAKHQTSGVGGTLAEFAALPDSQIMEYLGKDLESREGLQMFRETNQEYVRNIRAGMAAAGTASSPVFRQSSIGYGPADRLRELEATRDIIDENVGRMELDRQARVVEEQIYNRALPGSGGMRTAASDLIVWAASHLPGDLMSYRGAGELSDRVREQVLGTMSRRGYVPMVPMSGDNWADEMISNILQRLVITPASTPTLRPNSNQGWGANR